MARKWALIIGLAWALAGCAGVNAAPATLQTFLPPCPTQHFSRLRWSPDGERIAFLVSTQGQRAQIGVMKLDGSNATLLTAPGANYVLHGWSPDSQWLSFTHGSGLFLLAMDGSTRRVEVKGAIVRQVSWSSDSQQIAYEETLFAGGYHTYLYVADIGGGDPRRLTEQEGNEPIWLAAGDQIAFVRRAANGYDVFTIRPDGSGEVAIAHSDDGISNLQQSPDGAWLSFVSKGLPSTIVVTRPDGSDAGTIRVTGPENDYGWMPDSRRIFTYTTSPGLGLWVYDAATLVADIRFLPGATFIELPVWSPDGAQAAFVGLSTTTANNGATPLEIYLINADGTGLKPITDNPGKRLCFRWPF